MKRLVLGLVVGARLWGEKMPEVVPSFLAKLDRADKHLVDLKGAIDRYAGTKSPETRPYTVRAQMEGEGEHPVHRLHFTRSPANTDIPLIAADAIYNLRSSLEHLMGSMVASKNRDKVTFPIYWRGVWQPVVEGESPRRRKDRRVWGTIAEAVPAEALAFIKRLQPPDEPPGEQTPHALRLLNQLSNADRHAKLPLVAHGMKHMLIEWQLPDGSVVRGAAVADDEHFLEDNAQIRDVPVGAVYRESVGTPEVAIRTALVDADGKPTYLPVVEFVEDTLAFLRAEVIPKLAPFATRR